MKPEKKKGGKGPASKRDSGKPGKAAEPAETKKAKPAVSSSLSAARSSTSSKSPVAKNPVAGRPEKDQPIIPPKSALSSNQAEKKGAPVKGASVVKAKKALNIPAILLEGDSAVSLQPKPGGPGRRYA